MREISPGFSSRLTVSPWASTQSRFWDHICAIVGPGCEPLEPVAAAPMISAKARARTTGRPMMRIGYAATFCLTLLAAAPNGAAELNDYPTAARADYVFACMKTNGDTRQ